MGFVKVIRSPSNHLRARGLQCSSYWINPAKKVPTGHACSALSLQQYFVTEHLILLLAPVVIFFLVPFHIMEMNITTKY